MWSAARCVERGVSAKCAGELGKKEKTCMLVLYGVVPGSPASAGAGEARGGVLESVSCVSFGI